MTTPRVPSQKKFVSKDEIEGRFSKERHEAFMRRAIENSRKAGVLDKTGGAFGAVIVDREGNVLADGFNHVVAKNDPTWHGEMHAIRQACTLLQSPKLDGCLLYTSAEPCPMCLAAAYWAGLDGVIWAATTGDSKQYGNFDDTFILAEMRKPPGEGALPIVGDFLRAEAIEVWKEYSKRPDKTDY